MRIPGSIVLALVLLSSASSSQTDSTWLKEIQSLESTYGGHLGMMAKNLKTGETIAYNSSERFPTASVIKLPVMAAFFSLVDQGRLDTNARVTLTAEDKKPGSGVLQFLSEGSSMTVLDAVRLMIVLSDNTGTNLVLDRLGSSHDERLKIVNDFLVTKGLTNTHLLNRLYSWNTKRNSPEGVRYGIGVSTPEDMVILLESLYKRTLASPSSCDMMMGILKQQFYDDIIPRYLPASECKYLDVAHKTGSVAETKVDVGLVLSDRAEIAMAIFIDKHPDHAESIENRATVLGAQVARVAWNHFTGMTGLTDHRVDAGDVDWTRIPGGSWAIFRSPAAPFPHKERANGYVRTDGTRYPRFPHYTDSSVIVFVPEGFKELPTGSNLIVHFHGHMGDNLHVLESDSLTQAMTAQKINALLVLVQGPYRARDSFSGKMEDEGGFRRLVEDVLTTMQREKIVKSTAVNRICVSGFSGGYRPAAFVLAKGGISDKVTDVFLFDALYANEDFFVDWLLKGNGRIYGAYTDHLEGEYTSFVAGVKEKAGNRVSFTKTAVPHDLVPRTFIGQWLSRLDRGWKQE
jgi:beta-lactamase class A